MSDRAAIDCILKANRYLVLATADLAARPWATPVFFAPLGADSICWVSSPESRHSRTIAEHPSIAVCVFDSTVEVGRAEAAYFDADARLAASHEVEPAIAALNDRLPEGKRLTVVDLMPKGPMAVYLARLRRSYILVRGGDPEHGNVLDMTLEV
ncbi:pyridoxamine 5'-phosphate oxidase family protein [Humibacter sp.]|uniref:pyridoxamine 5'-phosphate oxidase family protein n=1 Tax=Humibacter sp. TaxID=1940291 RepID=UPI002CCD0DEB|nr:pyridoxamine 5'-phosphate oxidase family protein [Humibacter sp.]HVX08949.1 pyridoxamine 5'-phosphate oxidase family protein [Humibacter sp.]